MAQDIPAPPEADVIKLARLGARLSIDDVVAKVRAAGGKLSATYLRDIERGHGGRRGQRVPARASEGLLAQIAHEVGVTPGRLASAGREDAARVLEEIRRRENLPGDDYDSVEVVPTEMMADDLGEILPAVRTLARAARRAHPDKPLRGADVFPATMPDAIRHWDRAAAHGIPQVELPTATAVFMVRDEQKARAGHRQGGHAAGLTRARTAARRRPLARSP